MDLFNKKILKETQKWLDEVIKDRNKWEKAYITQVKDTDNLLKQNKELTKSNNNLQEENQKLIDWIEKIINEVGIKEKNYYEGQKITIPYCENIKSHYIEGDWNKPSIKQKDIIIPSIRYTKFELGE